MNQLLAQVQQGKLGSMELLALLLRGDDFPIVVRRGFRISTDAGMRDIAPTPIGEVYAVPRDLPDRCAVEAVLGGRAELAEVAR